MTKIDQVEVLSDGEQVAAIATSRGMFIVFCVPDARTDTLESLVGGGVRVNRVNNFRHARNYYARVYGLD